MRQIDNDEDWEYISDTPYEFAEAIKSAKTLEERSFFENLRNKVLHEPAASNDVLMHYEDNEDGIYILRISDTFLLGKVDIDGHNVVVPSEYDGLFFFLSQDMYDYLGIHISIGQWLNNRNYLGIRYDQNNDLR